MTATKVDSEWDSKTVDEVLTSHEDLGWQQVEGESIKTLLIGHATPGGRMAKILNWVKSFTSSNQL
jgi:hypothetical protein